MTSTPTPAPPPAGLRGLAAPSFVLAGADGTKVTPASLRGRAALLLFVPAAFTPICTGELRAHTGGGLAPARLVVISCDSAHVLARWCREEGVEPGEEVLVGSDFWPHGEVATAFGAFDPARGWCRRTSVLLDDDGVVRWTTTSPGGVARDVARAREAVRGLATGRGSVRA